MSDIVTSLSSSIESANEEDEEEEDARELPGMGTLW